MKSAEHIGLEDFVICKTDGMPDHPDVLRKDVLSPNPRPASYLEAIKDGRLPCISSHGRKLG
jgi:hypothetical protein